jgi:hypothetical protein
MSCPFEAVPLPQVTRPHRLDNANRSQTRGFQVTSNNRTSRLAALAATTSVFVLAFSAAPAWAYYIDPGTGSMMLQLLLGGVAGALVVGKLYLQRTRAFIRSVGRPLRAG